MPHTNEQEERIKEVVGKCAYHLNAWFVDEGEYQPTEEEALLACEKEIRSLITEARAQERKEAERIIGLILPFAKGYIAQNDVGSNRKYLRIAEDYLSIDAPTNEWKDEFSSLENQEKEPPREL